MTAIAYWDWRWCADCWVRTRHVLTEDGITCAACGHVAAPPARDFAAKAGDFATSRSNAGQQPAHLTSGATQRPLASEASGR